MRDVGYVALAYLGAAMLYGVYALRLVLKERALGRRNRARAR